MERAGADRIAGTAHREGSRKDVDVLFEVSVEKEKVSHIFCGSRKQTGAGREDRSLGHVSHGVTMPVGQSHSLCSRNRLDIKEPRRKGSSLGPKSLLSVRKSTMRAERATSCWG